MHLAHFKYMKVEPYDSVSKGIKGILMKQDDDEEILPVIEILQPVNQRQENNGNKRSIGIYNMHT